MTYEEVYKAHQEKKFQDKMENVKRRKEYLAELKRTVVLSSDFCEQIEKNLIENGCCDIYQYSPVGAWNDHSIGLKEYFDLNEESVASDLIETIKLFFVEQGYAVAMYKDIKGMKYIQVSL